MCSSALTMRGIIQKEKNLRNHTKISQLWQKQHVLDLVSLFRIFLAWRKVREWLIVETNLVHTKLYFYPRKNQYVRSRRDGWCTFFMILFKEPKTPTDHVRLMHKLETLDRHWASSSKLTHKVLHEQLTHKLETKIYGSIPRLYQFIFYRNFRFDFKFQDTVLYWTSLLFLKTQKT